MSLPRAALSLLLVIVSSLAAAEAASQQAVGTRIDELFARWDTAQTPGAAVAVARGSEIVYENSFGLASLTYDVPISAETRFNVGSIAKHMTSTAILMLDAAGELALDDEVHRYIPELPDYGRPITIRQLLQHTSGLRDYRTLMFLAGWRSGDAQTNEQALRLVFRQQGLNFPTGIAFGYSNSNYLLAAEIVARVTGIRFGTWVHDNLLFPLGLHATRVRDDYTEIVPALAASYAWRGADQGYFEDTLVSSAVGAGNLITSLGDLLIWADYLLTADVNGTSLLSALSEQAVLAATDALTGYGFGLYVGTHRGLRVVHHGGGTAGNRAHLMLFPDQDVRIVVLANTSAIRAETAVRNVADIVLENLLDPALGERGEQIAPALPLAAYAGLYELETGVFVEFAVAGDVPYVSVAGGSAHPVHVLGEHLFGTDEDGVVFRFFPDGRGTISRLMLEIAQAEIPGNRIPPLDISESALQQYAGTYFSEDLEAFYEIEAGAGGILTMQQLRLEDVTLRPVGKDQFREEPGGNLRIDFHRGRRGRIEGFELSVSRARDIAFTRE